MELAVMRPNAMPTQSNSGQIMQQSAANKIAPQQTKIEIPEIKKSLPLRKIDEELSEFERARQTSKTWSMGQD